MREDRNLDVVPRVCSLQNVHTARRVLALAPMRASTASGLSFDLEFGDAADPPRPSLRSRRLRSRPVKWPLVLCAFVAVFAACGAFMESPVGQRQAVRAYTDAVHGAVATAWQRIARR
jgi:hypothetical protein